MTAIGSLVFCTDCGNLLDETEGEKNILLKCDVCGAVCKGTFFPYLVKSFLFRLLLTNNRRQILQSYNHPVQTVRIPFVSAR
jgi:RNA polymerases M/15 Kd subunit